MLTRQTGARFSGRSPRDANVAHIFSYTTFPLFISDTAAKPMSSGATACLSLGFLTLAVWGVTLLQDRDVKAWQARHPHRHSRQIARDAARGFDALHLTPTAPRSSSASHYHIPLLARHAAARQQVLHSKKHQG